MSYATVNIMVDNGIYDGNDRDFIPHTFLKVTHPDGSTSSMGFAPIITGLEGPGAIHDDSEHPLNALSDSNIILSSLSPHIKGFTKLEIDLTVFKLAHAERNEIGFINQLFNNYTFVNLKIKGENK